MSIKVKCPNCTKTLTVPEAARGKAVKCPGCDNKVAVPANGDGGGGKPAAKKKAGKKAGPIEDESGFSGLDLRRVADHEANVCPKCGYDLDLAGDEEEEVTECPQCGWDVAEGGLGEKARKKQLKGPDPDKFYPGLWKNSWAFVGINLMLAIRTFLYVAMASVIFFVSTFLYLYISMWPPRMFFFGPLSVVAALMIPGWFWFLDTEVIKLTLERRDRFKRINFDFFAAAALGVKFVVWNVIFAGPLLLIPGVVCWALCQYGGLPVWAAGLILGACYLPILALWPVALTHMTMPIQGPGWMFWKVVPIGLKCIKPLTWWLTLFCFTNLPVALIMGAVLFFTGPNLWSFGQILESNSAIARAQANYDYYGSAKNKPKDLVDPKWLTDLTLLEPITIGSWRKKEQDIVNIGDVLFTYSDKDSNKDYKSRVYGTLETRSAGDGQQVAEKTSTGTIALHKLDSSHYIAVAAFVFSWIICVVILALTCQFNMRTNGYFAYYFRERLDLQVLLKEYKYVATISREKEEKHKTTEQVFAQAVANTLVITLIGLIFGMLIGAMGDLGIVKGIVWGLLIGGELAAGGAGIGMLVAAFNVSPVWGLLIFFSGFMCGIPHIMFLIKEWDDARLHFFQWIMSMIVVAIMIPIMLISGINLPWFGGGAGAGNQPAQVAPDVPARDFGGDAKGGG